jgi:hypothetical protein
VLNFCLPAQISLQAQRLHLEISMANWFARLMGSAPAPARSSSTGRGERISDSSGFRPSAMHSAQQPVHRQSSSVVNAQRETLRTLVSDTLREHGIPPVWISTDVMTVSSQGRLVFQIILTLKFWDESLPLYFSALEASYMTRVDSTNRTRPARTPTCLTLFSGRKPFARNASRPSGGWN